MAGHWTPPPREECVEDSLEVEWLEPPCHWLVGRLWFHGALLVDFVLVHVREEDERTIEIARIDCRHGEVHFHQFGRSGAELRRMVMREVQTPQDVYSQWEPAMQLMTTRYSEQARRWKEG